MTLPFGFRIVGPVSETRRLINWAAAFSGYASCDERAEVHNEAYLSAFTFGAEFRQLLEISSSVKGYSGPCWSPWLWWDIDREDNLAVALTDAQHLAVVIDERFRLGDDDLLVFFSGAKGFHLGLPTSLWSPGPSASFNRLARRFCERVAEGAGVIIDANVYDQVRSFRAPNSRHPKTGLHKCRLSLKELLGLSVDAILRRAERPEPFDVPAPIRRSDQAAADWQAALQAVEHEAEAKAERCAALATGTSQLNRSTREFMLDGSSVAVGERALEVFKAAANLAEFGCPPALAHALLTEPALDSGLSPSEARRQIECGLRHVGPIPPVSPAALSTPTPSPPVTDPAALQKQLAALWNSPPPDVGEAGESAQDRRDAGTHDFPFGANMTGPAPAEGGQL